MIRIRLFAFARLAPLALALVLVAPTLYAAVDSVQVVLAEPKATPQTLSSFAYNPLDDSMYTLSFGANAELRRITDVDGAQNVEIMATKTEIELFLREYNPDRPALSPVQNAIMLNPQTLGTGPGAIAPYSVAIINESATTRTPLVLGGPTPVNDPAATKRFYQYNLQSAANGNQVFSTPVTAEEMQLAVGQAPSTNVTINSSRQGAWSGDGQSIYVMATGASQGFAGLWEIDPLNGTAAHLLDTSDEVNTEVAVTTTGGVDSIYLRGSAANNNVGGIDKFTYDGTTLGARSVVVPAAQLREFLDVGPGQVIEVASMASDDQGNIYFMNTESPPSNGSLPERRGIYKVDPQGRIVKVTSYRERDIALTGALGGAENPPPNGLRLNTRQYNHSTAGEITQLLYAENTPLNLIAGANVFEVGDFNRDGDVTGPDFGLLAGSLKTRGTALTLDDDYKFDLNGSYAVDWKDVKILQQFTGFATGDVNFDFTLGLGDLDVLGANYHTLGGSANKIWTTGDLGSIDPLYASTTVDANIVNEVDVQLFADAWLALSQPINETDLTSRGYTGQFLDDVLDAFGFGTLPGDFDADGDVDGADFLDWQVQLGTTVPAGTGADSDSDGVVEGSDLNPWKTNFGQTAAVPASAAIPEPAAASLASLAIAALAVSRRRTAVPC